MKLRSSLSLRIVLGIVLGFATGLIFGKSASPLGDLGGIVIQLIKACAGPLLFFAILNGVLKTEMKMKHATRLVGLSFASVVIALAIGIGLSDIFQPGASLSSTVQSGMKVATPASGALALVSGQKVDAIKMLEGFAPKSFVHPFQENSIITLVVMALLFGFGLKRVRDKKLSPGSNNIENAVHTLYLMFQIIITWVIQLAPIAVFGVVAKTIGEFGLEPLKGLSAYVGVGLLGFMLHVGITYQAYLVFVARVTLKKFWTAAREPVVYALGANSSLATLPVTLTALEGLGVSRSSAVLGACVGTNLHHAGIVLYEGMAVFFVAQAYGIHLTLTQQIVAAVSSIVAAIGIAGVPEAGFISLALVLTTVGLPTEILPLLLTVDWILARGRSAVNVLSDMVISVALDN